jgi:hypothetical protein
MYLIGIGELLKTTDVKLLSWRLSGVLHDYSDVFRITQAMKDGLTNIDVASRLRLSDPSSLFNGPFRFYNCISRGLGGVARVPQREKNEHNASKGDEYLAPGDPEHVFRPFRHLLLGVQIALSAALFLGGVGLLVGAFYGAANAIKNAFDRSPAYGLLFFGWLAIGMAGTAVAAAIPVYWLSVCEAC